MKRFTIVLFLSLFALPLLALEGKWTPQQVLELDPAWLKKQGLELSPKQLWDASRGTGLLAATVNVGGCSGGFISPEGLIITNHHCLFGILQEHSTPSNDIIANGYLARSRTEELSGKTVRATIPRKFTDVTSEVTGAVPAGATDTERTKAIERKQKELVARCEKEPNARCKVGVFEGGLRYTLVESIELSDIRLVYAPPRSIGEYGGETDNWMWPRHTGDFSIARAYVSKEGKPATFSDGNVPYKPQFFFPIAKQGVRPGDFVMVLGYPGITYRSLISEEMSERRDLYFTRREQLYGEWIRVLEEASKDDPAGSIAVASKVKSLSNGYKNAQGQLAGFKRGSILERRQDAEAETLKWVASHSTHRAAVAARNNLANVVAEQRRTWESDFLLTAIPLGAKSLYFGTTIVRASTERMKADLDREVDYMERELPRLREKLEREQGNYFAPADKKLFASFVRRAASLPADQRIRAIDSMFGAKPSSEEISRRINELYGRTRTLDLQERLRMFAETEAQLRARQDPILELSFALDEQLRELKDRREKWDGTISRLRPEWRRAVLAQAGKPVAPDANSTLRVSFAHVMGYVPRDGMMAVPQTTLRGAIEKHTGSGDFDLPARVLQAAEAKRYGPWKDPKLGDIPVAFLADADTTGGNSGSPVVNGRGELVGVNFDRVWENVAGDFGFNPEVSRNVNVDVRYMLWLLDQVENADSLLKELGVRK